ncbi:hypothetical protein VPH35_117685 [Triticum aestivum]
MASSGSMTRPPCANHEDLPNKWGNTELDKVKEKDMETPSCWCGDVCKVKVSTDHKKSWTEGRRFCVYPNYAHDDEEHHEKEKMERKKREEERARKEKVAREEEKPRKVARARDAQEEDVARYKKGKGPMFP